MSSSTIARALSSSQSVDSGSGSSRPELTDTHAPSVLDNTRSPRDPSVEDARINKLRRRIIWGCIWGYLLSNVFMFVRYFFPRVLFEPSTIFHIGYPSDFSLGVNEEYKQKARIWIIREADRIFVIYARCTHLGCTPDWKPSENKFKCPCHGSGYTPEGINFEGPAPRPMDRAHVELDAQGKIVVDTSELYEWDRAKSGRDEFNDPGAFIPV